MAGTTLDTGALIAADRNDGQFWSTWARLLRQRRPVALPTVVLAQSWRGPRSARIARVADSCVIVPLDERLAHLAGELCGRARTSDIVDATVVVVASMRGDTILTSDPRDILYLAAFVSPPPSVFDITRLRLPDSN